MTKIDEKLFGNGFFGVSKNPAKEGIMNSRYTIPPFSTFDTFSEQWQSRKKAWIALGLKGEEGRREDEDSDDFAISYRKSLNTFGRELSQKYELKDKGLSDEHVKNIPSGVSVYDPVLCELMYKWFTFKGWTIGDPFAGGCTRGVIADLLGRKYVGVEVRDLQVNANIEIGKKLGVSNDCRWLLGDSYKLKDYVKEQYDFSLSCPPYFTREVYSSDTKDGSAHKTYKEFMVWYTHIYQQTVDLLKDNRFLAITVGNIREQKTGIMLPFVSDTIQMFLNMGLSYYNELILINSPGSLRLRTNRPFCASRKVGNRHQNVLIFYKGDPNKIEETFRVPVGNIFD